MIKKTETATKEKGQPLLVTTEHRGVFFGYGEKTDKDTIELTDARNCFYWSANLRGFLGLAERGPDKECKIGPRVKSLILRKVTLVSEVTDEAEKAWEKSGW